MLTETKTLYNTGFAQPYNLPPEETAYFDIETTGFSAGVTALYLIGCIYYENGNWQLIQWFAEDNKSEKEALTVFSNFIKSKKHLICYNGNTFDLPYLRKKYEKHGLKFNTDKLEIIDFYRVFSSFKNFLSLDGLKQKDIESYLGIAREDKLSGRELIEWYTKYLRLRFSNTAEKENIFKTLLLHNSDDLIGMAKLTELYNFLQAINNLITSNELLDIKHEIKYDSKKIIFYTVIEFNSVIFSKFYKNDFALEIVKENTQNKLILPLNILETELKFFYKDYKNYYYLPKEDMAIHKNLAAFVDKENKEKAIAANCYTKHTGIFIKIPVSLNFPMFKSGYEDKALYVLLDEKLLSSAENLSMIFKSVLKYLVK